jgi:hypothetical protein
MSTIVKISLFSFPQLPEKSGEHGGTFLLQYTAGDFYLMIKLLHLQEIEYRTGTTRLGIHRSDDYTLHPGLYDGSGTHLARFQGNIHGAVFQSPVTGLFARLADGSEFRMGERIFIRIASVVAPRNDFTILNDHTANRNFVDGGSFFRLCDSRFHKFFVLCHRLFPSKLVY